MRTATILARGQIDWWPGNLFRGCCPCICLTLKLLSQLWLVLRACVFIFPHCLGMGSKKKNKTKNPRSGAPFCQCSHACVYLHVVCAYLPVLCVFLLFLCTESERGLKNNKERKRGDAASQSILPFPRSFFHVLPTNSQSVCNQSVA